MKPQGPGAHNAPATATVPHAPHSTFSCLRTYLCWSRHPALPATLLRRLCSSPPSPIPITTRNLIVSAFISTDPGCPWLFLSRPPPVGLCNPPFAAYPLRPEP